MTALLKQRLVGAIVLISLGIIFIPMLLTGTGGLTTGDLPTNIPPKPLYEIQAPAVLPLEQKSHPEPVLEPAPESVASSDAEQKSEILADKPDSKSENDVAIAMVDTADTSKKSSPAVVEAEQTSKPEANAEKDSNTENSAIAKKKEQKNSTSTEIKSDKKSVSKSETKPAANTTTAKLETVKSKEPIVTGWVVQLGSFSVEKNALKLRDKLRKNGHASFVEEFERQGKTSYRVRVGPELTRELADNLKTQLKKETRIDGLVMAFPGK